MSSGEQSQRNLLDILGYDREVGFTKYMKMRCTSNTSDINVVGSISNGASFSCYAKGDKTLIDLKSLAMVV